MPKVLKSGEIIISDNVLEIPDVKLDILDPLSDLTQNEVDEHAAHALAFVNAAEKKAEKILEDGRRRMDKERQEMLARTQSECEHLRAAATENGYQTGYQDGYQRGYNDALQKKTKELDTAMLSARNELHELQLHINDYMAKYEDNLRWMAIDIASKVMCKKIADDDTQMLELVKRGIHSVKNAEWISVTLSDQTDKLYTALAEEIKASHVSEKVQISLKDVPVGTCRIETPNEVLDVSISEQLENLKEYFQ